MGNGPRAARSDKVLRCGTMPDEPRTSNGDDAPGTSTPAVGPADQVGTVPPAGEDYRWHGPSGQAHPGTETHTPYGSPYEPRHSPQGPYGSPQGQPPYMWPYVPPPPARPPLTPEERRRRMRRGIAFGIVLVLAVGAGIGIGAAIAPTSPSTLASTLVSNAVSAATRAGTYHYVELSTTLGAPDDIKGDAAPDGGRQIIRQRCSPVRTDTTNRTSLFDLRLVDGVVYFRGNLVAVVDELGVPPARATSVVGKWVKVAKGETKLYSTFAEGITTSSNAAELRSTFVPLSSKAVPDSSPASTEVLGALFKTAKSNKTIGTAELVLETSSSLPREFRGSADVQTARETLTWKFSAYGEKVDVTAPAHPLSYASLHARTPAKTACA